MLSRGGRGERWVFSPPWSAPGREAAPGLDCHSHKNRWRRRKAQKTENGARTNVHEHSRTKTRTKKIIHSTGPRRGTREDAHGEGDAPGWGHDCRKRAPERDGDTKGGHPHGPEAPTQSPKTVATQRSWEWTHRRVPARPDPGTPRLLGVSPSRLECAGARGTRTQRGYSHPRTDAPKGPS